MSTPPQGMPPQSAPPRHGFKKTLLTGLLTLLPIWLTWVVVKFVFVLLSDVSKPWVQPLSRRIAEGNPLLGWFADDWVQTTIAMIATLLVIRSEEQTSELQSLMRMSYAVFCLQKTTHNKSHNIRHT